MRLSWTFFLVWFRNERDFSEANVTEPFSIEIAHFWYIKILRWLRDLGSKLQIFHDSIVSQLPKETLAQRKPNHI